MKERIFVAEVRNIPAVTDFLDGEMEKDGCPMKTQLQVDTAADEIFTNISQYAYQGAVGNATVQYDFDPERKMVSVTFRDQGVPFDPTQRKDPDITKSAEQRDAGGLGIYIVKKMMDDMKSPISMKMGGMCLPCVKKSADTPALKETCSEEETVHGAAEL